MEETITQTARRYHLPHRPAWVGRTLVLPISPEIRRALPLVTVVSVGAVSFLVAAVWSLASEPPNGSTTLGALALLGSAVIAEAFPVPIEGVSAGRTSLATVFIVAAAVIYDWRIAGVVGFLTMATVEIGRRRHRSHCLQRRRLHARGRRGGWDGRRIRRRQSAHALHCDARRLDGVLRRQHRPARAALHEIARAAGVQTLRATLGSTTCRSRSWRRLRSSSSGCGTSSPYLAIALVGPLVAIALYQRRQHDTLDRLRELDRLKDEFIAITSHELRTPLASVYGAAMTLQRRELGDEQRESLLGVIYRESGRLARLVDQVLWASRLESAHVTQEFGSFDPVELVDDVVAAEHAHLPPTVSLTVAMDDASPRVAADGEKVKQVLVNLIDNAVKYSTDSSAIEVSLRTVDDRVRFSVRDDGLGIPLVEQQRIFDKFHRLDPDMTRGVGGTGLGLYICKQLVDQMNGRIWVASQEGEGSTFAFELPTAQA